MLFQLRSFLIHQHEKNNFLTELDAKKDYVIPWNSQSRNAIRNGTFTDTLQRFQGMSAQDMLRDPFFTMSANTLNCPIPRFGPLLVNQLPLYNLKEHQKQEKDHGWPMEVTKSASAWVHKMGKLWEVGMNNTSERYSQGNHTMQAATFGEPTAETVVPFSFYFSQLYQAAHHYAVPPTLFGFQSGKKSLKLPVPGAQVVVKKAQYVATIRQYKALAQWLLALREGSN